MSPRTLASPLVLLLACAAAAAEPAQTAPIVVKGSDTIGGELGPALAKAFEAASPGSSVRWEGLGSGTAFPGLFDGSADLGASSRSVNAQELARAKELGIPLKELVLGYDGIAVIVHPSNPVRQLTVEQLSALFTGKVASWAELGGGDARPVLYGRPSYSGTHVFFQERVLRRGNRHGTEAFAPRTVYLEHSEEIFDAVAKDPAAVAYVGMGWVKPGVEALAVAAEPGARYVKPAVETVRTGTYPIYRPLLLYTRGEPQGELRRFLQFVLAGDGRKLVAAHDFTPADVPSIVQRTAAPSAAAARPPQVYRVHFAAGRTALGLEAEPTLELVVAEVKRSGARVRLVGNADTRGRPEENLRLAKARAAAVAERLVRLGLRRDTLLVEVRGTDAPVATNETAVGRRANRRVDVEVLPRL